MNLWFRLFTHDEQSEDNTRECRTYVYVAGQLAGCFILCAAVRCNQFGRQLRRKWVGVWIPIWTKTWRCTCTEPPLWGSYNTLLTGEWRIHWEGVTTQVYRESYVPPTNPGELGQCPGSHFTKRSCWWLVLRVCSDMRTSGLDMKQSSWAQFCFGCSCRHKNQRLDFKSFTSKLNMGNPIR